ncbi:MAG: DsbA family protein [Acidimicrobiales bacterium]|nr:DsbA family protein [Acidimicrobiales bacterium]
MIIEVFAELACPFTHLALRRIVQRRRDDGLSEPHLRIRPWPLELVNGEALDPHDVGKEISALRAQISPDLYAGFDEATFPSTSMPGFRLVEAAYAVGEVTGERVSLELRWALFEEGRDISDPEVLGDVARAHDLALPGEDLDAEVERLYAEGKERGVEGSPHFFVDDYSAFCPLLDIQKDDAGDFHLTLDEAAVDDLLDGWFAAADQTR